MKNNSRYDFNHIHSVTSLAQGRLNHQSVQQYLLLFFIVVLAAGSGCSGGALTMTSDRRSGDIVIDGNDSEWQDGLYYEKNSDIVYGIRNDDEYVYVFLKTKNRSLQKRILGSGFTIWFDAEGGTSSTFGIRYPFSRKEAHADIQSEAVEEQNRMLYDQLFPELEILGSTKNDIQRFPILEAPGIRVRMGRVHETLVYELQVPLKKTIAHPYAIGLNPKNQIGIGFETEEFKHEEHNESSYSDKGFSDHGGMEGPSSEAGEYARSGHGGGHRGGGSESKEQPTQLDLWLSVLLPPSTSAR